MECALATDATRTSSGGSLAPRFSGVDLVGRSVADLDRSERFYTEVLGLIRFSTSATDPVSQAHDPRTGVGAAGRGERRAIYRLQHGAGPLGFGVSSREELVEWQRRLDSLGVEYTPIRDMEFGYHLNFRDPDNIALELSAPNEVMTGFYRELQSREVPERRSSPGFMTTSRPLGECDRSFTLGGAQITCAHTMTLLGSDGSSKLRRPQRHPECRNWQCGGSRVPRTAA